MENLMNLIDELENELIGSTSGVFGRKKVDVDRCLSLVNELRSIMPSAVKEAIVLMQNEEKYKEETENYCTNIVDDAQARAEEILSQSEILKRAEREAETIRAQALQYYDTMKQNARDYIDAMLKDMENFLADNITCIRNNREELRGSMVNRQPK